MRVLDIINAADPAEVEAEYRRAYPGEVEDHGSGTWANADSFCRYRQIVNNAIGVIDEPMSVVIKCVREDDEERYDVSGRRPNDDASYAIEFSPWGEWKLMEVEYPADLDVHQAACHLYYEMTWCGWPEQIIQKRDELFDLKEQVQRDLAERE